MEVYALSLLAFSAVSVVGLYPLQRVQGLLPLNPTDFGAVPPPLAFNTAVSFVTNTNWQNYGGESTMSHLTQMAGLTVQNFVSAAVGLAVAVALVRGLTRRRSATIGNFWVDLTRVDDPRPAAALAPVALVLASQGVVQNLSGPPRHNRRRRDAGDPPRADREPGGDQGARHERRRPLNANSAHPFENPTAFTNLLEIFALLADPVRAHLRVRAPGRRPAPGLGGLRGDVRDLDRRGRDRHVLEDRRQPAVDAAPRRNMEGKEVRFGAAASGLFAASTTGTSTGAVNSAHDSFTPIGGAVPLVHMMLGEVSPGGVGAGLYGMLVFALLAVFIAGPDGRADARVPGQEDPGGRDEARRGLPLVVPPLILAFAGDLGRARHGTGLDPQPGPARPLGGRLRVHVRRRTTTAPRSAA